ncbi:MAG: lipid-A-disaccharide synthase N-terminal domain-containing protein [Omnitrophica bacterium]|nr:lipid-A-disaccharide synthase N-terminal domain-containing protein [Candidatus Omnitrophota bacterium]
MNFANIFSDYQINSWTILGFFAQFLFFMRFFVQWIASEKKKQSIIPVSFWYFSIAGCLLLLIYAIYRKDIVIVLGQSVGSFVYLRNLTLIYRQGKTAI